MNCDFCDDKATVFFTQVSDGAMKKIALCESCAEERGVTDPEGLLMADQLLSPAASSSSGSEGNILSIDGAGECPACHFTLADYQKVGRLGCSQCYYAFNQEIEPRLPTLHKGLKHEGRVPEGMVAVEQMREEIAALKVALQQAILAEDYEEAANLRDRIQKIETKNGEEPVAP